MFIVMQGRGKDAKWIVIHGSNGSFEAGHATVVASGLSEDEARAMKKLLNDLTAHLE